MKNKVVNHKSMHAFNCSFAEVITMATKLKQERGIDVTVGYIPYYRPFGCMTIQIRAASAPDRAVIGAVILEHAHYSDDPWDARYSYCFKEASVPWSICLSVLRELTDGTLDLEGVAAVVQRWRESLKVKADEEKEV